MKAYMAVPVLLFFSIGLAAAPAQEYGKIRPLNERAAQIVQQRDRFVTQVLTSYGIPHEENEQGAVVRIKMDGRWLAVTAIEVVPVVEEAGGLRQVTAHTLYFTTATGILELRSELKIR
ncbi:MAG: hypothetical protein M0009_03730 [Deltaproteobacteria bacterium]|nr:hypothetical protein [Deltaproteobacteria bacterium]